MQANKEMSAMFKKMRSSVRSLSLLATSLCFISCDPSPDPKSSTEVAPAPTEAHSHDAEDHYEVIPRVVISQRSFGVKTVVIESQEHPMELEVYEDHDLVNEETKLIRNGKEVSFAESGHSYPLVGHVVGEEDSAVQLVRTERGLEGVILAKDKMFELKGDEYSPRQSHFGEVKDIMGYAHSHEHDHEHGFGHEHRGLELGGGENSGFAGVERQASNFEPGSGNCKAVSVVLVADWTHVQVLGGVWQAEFEMMRRMGEVNMIFRKQLGVRFRLRRIHSFPDRYAEENNPKFNIEYRDPTPLSQFATWKGQVEPEAALAHLFMARTSFGTLGKAKVSGLCDRQRGTSVSNYMGTGIGSTIIAAHEIAHNFGSSHDPTALHPQIMSPSRGNSTPTFSERSVQQMLRALPRFSCLKPTKCQTIRAQQPDSTPDSLPKLDLDPIDEKEPDLNVPDSDGNPPSTTKENPSGKTATNTDEDSDSKSKTKDSSSSAGAKPEAEAEPQANAPQEKSGESGALERCSMGDGASEPWSWMFTMSLLGLALRKRKQSRS